MKLISIFMSVVIVFTTLMGVTPVETQAAATKTASVDNDISIEGTNSFGNLLADKLDNEMAEQTQNVGYNVFSAEVSGTEVTVKFETMSDCTLLVGIYDEAGEKLIATGTTKVTAGEIEKTITIETNEMPQYFYLKVYLIDETTMRPMCEVYESSLYTKEMQEFLAKTVNDFDSERVLNLDEDKTNNFAVYNDEVTIVESDETVNNVVTADIENEEYIIENADSSISSLKTDDVVAIETTSGEDLVIKVGEISVDDNTVTITGQDVVMEEIFDYVKIDITQDQSEAIVDTSNISEGISFFDKFVLEYESEEGVTVGGEIGYEGTINVKYFYDSGVEIAEVTVDLNYGISISVSGALKWDPEIPTITYPLGGLLSFKIEVHFVFEAKMQLSTEGTISQKIGFSYDNTADEPIKNLTEKPYINFSLEMEGSVFIGFSITPKLIFIDERVSSIGLEVLVGGEISATDSYFDLSTERYPESKHECKRCLKGEIILKLEVSAVVEIFNCEELSIKRTFVSADLKKIADFYHSLDYADSGFTTCPHQLYRLTICVVDKNNSPVEALVDVKGESGHITDSEGYCNMYFSENEKVEIKIVDGDNEVYENLTMPGKAHLITINLNTTAVSTGKGTCGDNLTWELANGTLTISGKGAMYDFDSTIQPWSEYKDDIKKVVIDDGVASIGGFAFRDCPSLTSITILDSVTSIGGFAFYNCDSLTSITIPDSVTRIDVGLFSGCDSLASITIPDSVTYIDEQSFCDCDSLTTITIPDSVRSIHPAAFLDCDNLVSIEVDTDNNYLSDIKGVLFNKNKTFIRTYPAGKSNNEYVIPDSVTGVDRFAFYGCDSITSITIPDSVTSIGLGAFDCDSVTSITIQNPKCEIDDFAISDTATIYGYPSSTAQAYAEKYNINFVALSKTFSLSNLKKSAVVESNMTEMFTDLLPNEVYNFYVMKSRTAENPFSTDNLLYITQAVSDENGGLIISYIPKEACDTAEIFIAGLTREDISAAEITMPEIEYNGENLIVNPNVVFEDETLVEGVDYNIEGGYLVTAPGEYTITIKGIGDYTNTKDVTYTVKSAETKIVYGDANCDGKVTIADATAIFQALGNPDKYGLSTQGAKNADVTGNDGVMPSDAVLIQAYDAKLISSLPISA